MKLQCLLMLMKAMIKQNTTEVNEKNLAYKTRQLK